MSAVDDRTEAKPGPQICAECGRPFQPRRRGRPSIYCRPACRQRAWAVRQAEAALVAAGPDVDEAMLTASEPEVEESLGAVPVDPTSAPADDVEDPDEPGSDVAALPDSVRADEPVLPAVVGPAWPTDVRSWVAVLDELRAQLRDPASELVRRPWEHIRLYDALGRAVTALDEATPGGLDWLDRYN